MPFFDLPAQNKLAATILKTADMQFDNLVRSHNYAMDLFWNSSTATPQQIADALGTNAVPVFQAAGAVATFINTLKPGTIGDNPNIKPFTANPDGTVTINA
jgi:hypothetical protein